MTVESIKRTAARIAFAGVLLLAEPGPVRFANAQTENDNPSKNEISIMGSPGFFRHTQRALDWLRYIDKKDTTRWMEYVKSGLDIICEQPDRKEVGPGAFGLNEAGKTVAVFRGPNADLHWFASAIVHEADHGNRFKLGLVFWGIVGEQSADQVQQQVINQFGINKPIMRTAYPNSAKPSDGILQAIGKGC